MTRKEFIPFVQFTYQQYPEAPTTTYQVQQIGDCDPNTDVQIKVVNHPRWNSIYQGRFCNVQLRKNGIILYESFPDGIMLYSKVIPYSKLIRVDNLRIPASVHSETLDVLTPLQPGYKYAQHLKKSKAAVKESRVVLYGATTDPEVQASIAKISRTGRATEVEPRPNFETGLGMCGKHLCGCKTICKAQYGQQVVLTGAYPGDQGATMGGCF